MAAILHLAESRNRALKVNSFTTTNEDILAEFERQTGLKWTKSYTPLEELKQLEAKAWELGAPNVTVYTLRRIWTEGGTLYEKRDNYLIGDPPMETLGDQVRQAIQKQTQ